MNQPVQQQALTLVLRVKAGQGEALARSLTEQRKAMQRTLRAVSTLHFARFVVLPPSPDDGGRPNGEHYYLAIESNFDGELDAHLTELWQHTSDLLEPILSACEDWSSPGSSRELMRLASEHGKRAGAFFVAHGGLTVPRILADFRLRNTVHEYFDEHCHSLSGAALVSVARGVQAHVRELADRGAGFDLCKVDRGLSNKQGGFWSVALLYPFEILYTVLRGFISEWRDYLAAKRRPPRLDTKEIRARLDEIGCHEDRLDQNGLTHFVPIKRGRFRMAALKLMLRLAQELAERGGRTGKLGDLETIHFARWVILDDRRLLFFSNYDGSWEAYLGDFIDKASTGLTMIWTNTQHFPTTFAQFFKGARDEERFKRWTRAYQYPTQIWYSAYPWLSVGEVLANAEIREILADEIDEARAERLCRLA